MIYPFSATIPNNPNMLPTSHEVFTVVAQETGVTEEEMATGSRKREVVVAKQMAMYLLWRRWGVTQQRSAELLGYHDHTAIIYGLRVIQREAKSTPEIASSLNRMMTA